MFGSVKSPIGHGNQAFGGLVLATLERSAAEADRDSKIAGRVLDPQLCYDCSSALGDEARLLDVGRPEDDGEFLAAIATKDVFGAQRGPYRSYQADEDLVANPMAIFVVHALEVVHVQYDETERRVVPASVGQLGCQARVEVL